TVAVAGTARRHAERRIAVLDERAAALEPCVGLGQARRGPLRLLPRVVVRDLAQVLVGEVREQALHDLVAPPTRAVMLELRVEVAGGLTGDRWEIGFAVRPAGFAVAGGARDETLGHLG